MFQGFLAFLGPSRIGQLVEAASIESQLQAAQTLEFGAFRLVELPPKLPPTTRFNSRISGAAA